MKQHQISVIISTYNSEEFMEECLVELVKQTIFDKLEIYVVDAHSSQGEGEIVRSFQKQYDNIAYRRLPERIGIYAAWNIAIKATTAKFIFPFSTNDRLNPRCCEVLHETLVAHPNVDLIYGDTYLSLVPHTPFEKGVEERGRVMRWGPYSYDYLLRNNCIGPHPMWRRKIHEHIGYFDESYVALGDQEFWLRLGRVSRMMHIPFYTGMFWWTRDSLSGSEAGEREFLRVRSNYVALHKEDAFKLECGLKAVKRLMDIGEKKAAVKMLDGYKAKYAHVIAP